MTAPLRTLNGAFPAGGCELAEPCGDPAGGFACIFGGGRRLLLPPGFTSWGAGPGAAAGPSPGPVRALPAEARDGEDPQVASVPSRVASTREIRGRASRRGTVEGPFPQGIARGPCRRRRAARSPADAGLRGRTTYLTLGLVEVNVGSWQPLPGLW